MEAKEKLHLKHPPYLEHEDSEETYCENCHNELKKNELVYVKPIRGIYIPEEGLMKCPYCGIHEPKLIYEDGTTINNRTAETHEE